MLKISAGLVPRACPPEPRSGTLTESPEGSPDPQVCGRNSLKGEEATETLSALERLFTGQRSCGGMGACWTMRGVVAARRSSHRSSRTGASIRCPCEFVASDQPALWKLWSDRVLSSPSRRDDSRLQVQAGQVMGR